MKFFYLFLKSFFPIFITSLIFTSCFTSGSKKSVSEKKELTTDDAEQAKQDSKTSDGEGQDGQKSEEKVEELNKEKEGEKDKKKYDGLRYVGPAKKTFSTGVEKYFGEGCNAALVSWGDAFKIDANSKIAFNIALCLHRTGKIDESIVWYLKAFELDNTSAVPLYNAYLIEPDQDEKIDEYINKANKIKDLVERNNLLSWIYLKNKKYQKSIDFSKMALKEDEQNVEAMVNLGSAYYYKNMIELATMIFSTALQIDENNFRLQRMSGFLAYKQNNKSKAIKHFQLAKKINPEMPAVSNMLAILYMETEDFKLAKQELETALRIKSDFKFAKLNLAIALKGLKEYKASDAILIELESDTELSKELSKSVLYNKAILYLDADVDGDKKTERFDLAIKYFDKYLKLVKKRNRKERKKILGYKKEAITEKKKLESILKFKKRQELKRKKNEEEDKRFKEEELEKKAAAEKEKSSVSDSTPKAEKGKDPAPDSTPKAEKGKDPAPDSTPKAEKGKDPAPDSTPKAEKEKDSAPDSTPKAEKEESAVVKSSDKEIKESVKVHESAGKIDKDNPNSIKEPDSENNANKSK